MKTNLRVALAVTRSPVAAIQQNLENTARWTQFAKSRGADMICFPEMNVTGYSTRLEIADLAESIPGTITRALTRLAASENIVILAGMAEKDQNNGIFASHLVVSPKGIQGVYRKIHISPPEKERFHPGKHIPVFKTEKTRFGVQLCYDAHFPGLSTHMAVKGVDMILIPHASPRGTPEQKFTSWNRHLPARAFDNGIFVLACNQTGKNGLGLDFPGMAVVIGPSGEIIKNDTSGEEGVLIADLKADDLKKVRNHRMRYFLPNRRPDLYEA